jgi:protein-S-isoprenylcysteine O-methyltransferase Ste14
MTLSAWLPLLTLPGLVVMFKWELSDVEEFRISQFGQKYLRYKEKSWLLIPYLY